jgi:Putative phage abortive infection protein
MGQIPKDDEENEGRPWWIIIVSALLFLGVGLFIAYGANNPAKFKDLGTWGDFVGGTLNPILTFATFIGLLYTIHLQKRELRLTRNELSLTRREFERSSNALEAQNLTTKQQRFENTLFSMIAMLNQIVNAMDVNDFDKTKTGRDCFSYFYHEFELDYFHKYWSKEPKFGEILDLSARTYLPDPDSGVYEKYSYLKKKVAIYYLHDCKRVIDAYEYFYRDRESDLGHYFRVLYNIFRYIDRSEFADGIYAKILRAQLSNQELLIIFYNNATDRGKAFAALAERFELYDNMDTERLLRPEHIELASKKSFGKNPMTLPEEREHPR